MDIGRLAARVVIGGLFIGHGTQKLFGWFGGPGLSGTEQMMGALEMRPTRANAIAAGLSETAGGALLVAGAATPAAASSLIGTMITAIRKVHQPHGGLGGAGRLGVQRGADRGAGGPGRRRTRRYPLSTPCWGAENGVRAGPLAGSASAPRRRRPRSRSAGGATAWLGTGGRGCRATTDERAGIRTAES